MPDEIFPSHLLGSVRQVKQYNTRSNYSLAGDATNLPRFQHAVPGDLSPTARSPSCKRRARVVGVTEAFHFRWS